MKQREEIDPACLVKALDLLVSGPAPMLVNRPGGFELEFVAPPRDPQLTGFHAQAELLNDLAIAHRLALPAARDLFGLAGNDGFAIASIKARTVADVPVGQHRIEMDFGVGEVRRGAIASIDANYLATRPDGAMRIAISFRIMPAALVGFIRRGRAFEDFATHAIELSNSALSAEGTDRMRFVPGECDRLADGARVDHVPALVLIDRALEVLDQLRPGCQVTGITADFVSYADPRQPLSIALLDPGKLLISQKEATIAQIDLQF